MNNEALTSLLPLFSTSPNRHSSVHDILPETQITFDFWLSVRLRYHGGKELSIGVRNNWGRRPMNRWQPWPVRKAIKTGEPMIDYTIRRVSDATTIVRVGGMLDNFNRTYFFDCIGDLIDDGCQHVIIECHRLGHLSSGSLASLLYARKQAAKKGGRIYLTHLSSCISEAIETTKLGWLLDVHTSTEDALARIKSKPLCIT